MADLTVNYRIIKVHADVFVHTFNTVTIFIKHRLVELIKIEIELDKYSDDGTALIYLYHEDERVWNALLDVLTAMGIGFGID